MLASCGTFAVIAVHSLAFVWIARLSAAMLSTLRRANSSATILAASPSDTGPTRHMIVANTNVVPSATSDRPKSGRFGPKRHTNPNEPASNRLHPRARLSNGVGVGPRRHTSSDAMATHATARNARPPAHQPTSAQAAIAGTSNVVD